MSEKQPVKFGDICREVKLTTKDPIADGYERYIGLEHLDSGSLKIKRWGTIAEDNPSFTRVFKKGHILFGKRRPYLKKAAIAEFDGICSGDIIVMEPTHNLDVPELLPYIIQSNSFWKHAISTSSGSLSPRTKFKSLSEYPFSLGGAEEQNRQLNISEKFNKAINDSREAYNSFQKMFTALLEKKLLGNDTGAQRSIDQICTIVRGSSPRPKGDSRYYGGSIPRLMVEDIVRDGKYVKPCIDYLTEEGAKKSRLKEKGTLVIVCSGTPGTVGKPSFLDFSACIHDGIISLDNIDESIVRKEYLYYLLLLNQRQIFNLATHGGTFVNLTTSIVKKMSYIFPELSYQDHVIKSFQELEKYNENISKKSIKIELLRDAVAI
ncbi:restriction endonuclease subunit S [Vreelandella alkaliphila]|uniref:Restriction endonuclease subunit S n=1 Tax=Vreelandella alkaliphila TaxID=272774 RepID=A0AAJ2RU79_9GAMM|nr:restriction endonuclease subunit S [Halomonas alkaliphila]MDX5977942.1 restriction endonuclease subunit S [Halomonas alkaliphila]